MHIGHNSVPGTLLDVARLCHELEQKGLAWADADAAADALKDATKSVFAECLLVAEGKTVGEREANAYVDGRYEKHMKALDNARRAANRAKVIYEVEKTRVDLTRSNASTERTLAGMR